MHLFISFQRLIVTLVRKNKVFDYILAMGRPDKEAIETN